jgi:hypothetical protein
MAPGNVYMQKRSLAGCQTSAIASSLYRSRRTVKRGPDSGQAALILCLRAETMNHYTNGRQEAFACGRCGRLRSLCEINQSAIALVAAQSAVELMKGIALAGNFFGVFC